MRFCQALNLHPFPVTVRLVLRYIAYLVSLGRAYGTILNHLSALKHFHKFLGYDLLWDKDYRLQLLLRGTKRHLGATVVRKAPITVTMLQKFSPLFDLTNPLHSAMWALFLVAFFSFLRKSNLVVDASYHISPKVILRSDLKLVQEFAYITVRASKTIQFNERSFTIPLPVIPGSLLCPVSALVNHLHINRVPNQAPLFSVISGHRFVPISYTQFAAFISRTIKAIDLDPTMYSPHSFRRGGATFAFESQVPAELIKVQGDWHSDCYMNYLEMTDRQKNFAAARMANAILKM